MTPQLIRARILSVSQDELRRIVEELQAYPPHDCAELLSVCRAIQDELVAESRRLQRDRAEVSLR